MKHLSKVFLTVLLVFGLLLMPKTTTVYADGNTNEAYPEPTYTTTALAIPAPEKNCQLYGNA